MANVAVELATYESYSTIEGKVFRKGEKYSLVEKDAEHLLGLSDEFGRPYFKKHVEKRAKKVQDDEMDENLSTGPDGVVTLPDSMKKGGKVTVRVRQPAQTVNDDGEIDSAGAVTV